MSCPGKSHNEETSKKRESNWIVRRGTHDVRQSLKPET